MMTDTSAAEPEGGMSAERAQKAAQYLLAGQGRIKQLEDVIFGLLAALDTARRERDEALERERKLVEALNFLTNEMRYLGAENGWVISRIAGAAFQRDYGALLADSAAREGEG